MSQPFEKYLSEWTVQRLEEAGFESGDRFAVEFPREEFASRFTKALLEVDSVSTSTVELSHEGATDKLSSLEFEHHPRLIVSWIRRNSEDVNNEFEVTRGYATTIRNKLGQNEFDEDTAFLMIYRAGVEIETLDTTYLLFQNDGLFPLTNFEDDIKSESLELDDPSRAIMEVIQSKISFPRDPMENLEPLENYCELFEACRTQNGEKITELIPKTGKYLQEPAFEEDWFARTQELDDLKGRVEQVLENNSKHAGRIYEAQKVTKDTESELEGFYSEEFIERVRSAGSWQNLSRSDASSAEVDPQIGGSSQPKTATPEFENIEFQTDKVKTYGGVGGSTGIERHVLARAEGTFECQINYNKPIISEPIDAVDTDGNDLTSTGSISVEADTLNFDISGFDQSVPHFYSVDLYLGHSSKRGNPKNRFRLAILPGWFYDALGTDPFEINVEHESLEAVGEHVELIPPAQDKDTLHRHELEDDEESIKLDRSLFIEPGSHPYTERVTCYVYQHDSEPIRVDFLTEVEEPEREEIQFPLMFASVCEPDSWSLSDLSLDPTTSIDVSRGEIHSPLRGSVEIPSEDRLYLENEEVIIDDGTPVPRVARTEELTAGKPDNTALDYISDDLITSYEKLFQHFEERSTTPSTDTWDTDTCELVRSVLEDYKKAIDRIDPGDSPIQFTEYRNLGTIRSENGDYVRLTPFHPLMLAYGYRLSQWRDELVDNNLIGGFRFDRHKFVFTPVGFFPYRWNDDSNDIFSGQSPTNNLLWATYTPIEGPTSRTPEYVGDVISDKFKVFSEAFRLLFSIHPNRTININLVNMGDLGPVLEGLFDFFDHLNSRSDMDVPNINLQLFGSRSDGRELDRFFAVDRTESDLRETLENRDEEITDLMDEHISYTRCGRYFTESEGLNAHLSLFRGILDEQPGDIEVNAFPSGTRLDGLLPRDRIKVDSDGRRIQSQSGVAIRDDPSNLFKQIASRVNTLENSERNGSFAKEHSLAKRIQSSEQRALNHILDKSLWALHVEPKTDLDFYIKARTTDEHGQKDPILIHYSDQYDGTSPGYDVITTTKKKAPYVERLSQTLEDRPGLDELDAQSILTDLVAIDGEFALDIQKAEGRDVMELLGMLGGLAVESRILAKNIPDHTWIPLNLQEFARHDREYRRDTEGLLQYLSDDPASDDLCFIGIPNDGEELRLKLRLVEAKGGSSDVNHGVTQVQNAVRNLEELFYPDEPYADTKILKSEFGDILTRISTRLYHYDVITETEYNTIQHYEDELVSAEFDVEFLEGTDGSIGEVINIRQDIEIPESKLVENVRTIKCPAEVLRLLDSSDTEELEIHPEFDVHDYDFELEQIEKPLTEQARDSEIIESPSSDDSDTEKEVVQEPDKEEVKEIAYPEDTSEEPAKAPVETDESPDITESVEMHDDILEKLQPSPDSDLDIDVTRLASDLKNQFESLGVNVRRPSPSDISIGPRKIGVNIRPKEGQKIESIMNSLDSISVHIEAPGTVTGVPNPAEGAIRLEIPHDDQRDIYLREGFENLGNVLKEPLNIPLGVNTKNEHISLDLLEEHHLLVGGATGSGKSNFLSTIVCSLAVWHQPQEVQMSLLDPKGIDFGRFEGLPHVTTYLDAPSECVDYLLKLINEDAEERRELLKERGAASVQQHNRLADDRDFDPIPYHVIVIDEFADLMMSLDNNEQLEEAVSRFAQTGRALGYSVLLATQRPDHEIVSGKIKTNFNCRISFELPTQTDSRVILDRNGAEDLMGAGDMIAITSKGEQLHLQGYRLMPEDAVTILDWFAKP